MKQNAEGDPFQRFALIRPLGSGGFGAVYEASDATSDQRVALKELTNISPSTVLRFKQEFRALSGVHHPNLVSIRELIEQNGRWYIVMELVEGKDLVHFVRFGDDSGFYEERVRAAFLGVAKGLVALHAHGILHRDLKPSNVRVTPEGRAVLLDFGLATTVDSAGQSTHAAGVGTVLYMPPEQIDGRKLTTAADWYAFGTCLYEALTGQFPYDAGSAALIAVEKTRREAAHPSTLIPDLPADLADLCHALLRIAPEQRPSAAQVLGVLEGAAGHDAVVDTLGPDPAPERVFAGREAELGHLEVALSRTDEGAMRIVLVEGESGVGKSELVAEFLRRQNLRDPSTLTLRARCYENERVSYKAFDGCIDELAQVLRRMGRAAEALMPVDASLLAQLFPVLGDVPAIVRGRRGNLAADPTARRLQAFAALSALFAQLAEERPLILTIDDLQWADDESFRLMRALVEDARRPPILVLATIRPRNELEPDVLAQLEAVRALQCVDVIPLVGLPVGQAAQLAQLLLGPGADAKWAGVIAQESRGHPLFLSELIHFSRSRDHSAPGTLTLEAALRARVERLPKQARALLELVALAGRPHGTSLFVEALDGAKLEESVSVLLGAKLLRTRQQELACFHDRIRHVVVATISGARLSLLHKQLALALEQDPLSDPTEEASHWDLADEAEQACQAYERAAERAYATLAFVQAERLYARALELAGGQHDERHARLMIGRANAVGCAGRSAEAATLYQRAAQLNTSEEQRLRLRSKTAQHLLLSGDVHSGLAACRTLLSELGISLPRSDVGALARAVWDRVWLYLRGYDLENAAPHASDARRQLVLELLNELMKALAILRTAAYLALSGQHARRALELANPLHAAAAFANEAWLHNATGRRKTAARLFEKASILSERSGNPAVKALLKLQEGSACVSNWDWVRGSALLEEAESLYRAHVAQDPWSLTVTRYILGAAWYRLGEHARLAEKMDLWIGEARERHDRVAVALLSGMGHGWARHLMRRNAEEALRELSDAIMAVPAEPFAFAHLGHMIGSQMARAVLDSRAAHQWFELNDKQLQKPVLLRTSFGRETLRMVRAMAALRACEGATESTRRELLAEVRTHAAALGRSHAGFTQAYASHCLAQASALEGDVTKALALARAARHGFEQVHYIGAHAPAYLEGLIEGGQDASQKCTAALNAFRSRGWVEPQHAMLVMLPALPALTERRVASKVARKKLIHHYEVLAPLGSGGFGTVFEARDVQSGRSVALKELVSTSARSLERFKREFRALSDLHHPNIVRFDALFEHQGTWYIAMELVRGQDLVSYVRPGGELDHARLRQAFLGLLAGVAALHEAGFVHRDITPENVCVSDDGRAVLLDFGLIARAHDAGDADSVGNDSYAPPEQLEGATAHASADVYALGACLFHALSGRPPFEADSPAQLRVLKRAGKLRSLNAPKLRAFSLCATRMLEPHPAERPSLADVQHQLGGDHAGKPSRPSPLSLVPEQVNALSFKGRRAELARIAAAFDEARGGFRLLLVEGESGLGKSALVAEFARTLESEPSDGLVFASRCYENERLALKAFDGIVDQLARRLRALSPARCDELLPKKAALLAQLFPVLGTVPSIAKATKKGLPADPTARRALALSCLGELIERLSASQRLLLLIDDLQWADVESLRLLHGLSQRAQALPLLVVCTLRRSDEVAPELVAELAVLRTLEGTSTLSLTELSQSDRESLSAALLGSSADPALLRRISEESKGHPLFLRELADHAKTGSVHTSSGQFSLDDALRARVARFDPEARRLLALLALAGRPYSTQVFANALGCRELPLQSLSELLNQGLVRRRGEDALTCYHDRVRHIAVATLSETERRDLCAKLAAALENLPSCEPAERARLWDEAGRHEQAIPALEAAGDAALEKLAFEAADEHYARALALIGEICDERWRRLMSQRGHALVRMGKYAHAARMYAVAAEGAEGEQRVRLRVWAAQNLIQGAQVTDGLRAASQLLSELGVPVAPTEERALGRILWESARLKLRGIGLHTGAPVSSRDRLVLDALNELSQPVASVMFLRGAALSVHYVRRALAAGEPAHAARALAYEGILRSTRKPQNDHSALFARARELAHSVSDPAVLASVEVRSGIACLARDDYAAARDALLRGHELISLQCPGQPWLLTTARMQLGCAWYVLAEHATLAAHSESWIADARQREDLYGYATVTSYGFGFLRHLMRDDPATAQAELAEAMAPWPDEPFATHHFGTIIASIYTLSYQGGDAGFCWLERNEARFERAAILSSPVFKQTLYNLRATACLAAMAGADAARSAQLATLVGRHVRMLRKISSPLSGPFAELWSSALYALRGDATEAFRRAQRARHGLSAVHKAYSIAALFWEGRLEGGQAGAAKEEQAIGILRGQGWHKPERAVEMLVPAVRVFKR